MQQTPAFRAGVRAFTKAFASVIVHFKNKGPFCSYYPPQKVCLAPGILEKFSVLLCICVVELGPLGKC